MPETNHAAPHQHSDNATSEDLVLIRHHGERVVELVLNRPHALNAVSTAFAEALVRANLEVGANLATACIVVTSSSEKAFCVGADLKERNGFSDADLRAQRPIARAAYRSFVELPMPVIAAVDGFALGGGYEIALSCDLIVAGEGAVVGLPETSVGVIPGGGGTQLLSRRVGYAKAANAIFTARRFTAQQAHDAGMIDQVAPAGGARDAALELASSIAENSPVCLRESKSALRTGFDLPLAAGLDVEDGAWRAAAFSADRREGVAAFAEKRKPRWPGTL